MLNPFQLSPREQLEHWLAQLEQAKSSLPLEHYAATRRLLRQRIAQLRVDEELFPQQQGAVSCLAPAR